MEAWEDGRHQRCRSSLFVMKRLSKYALMLAVLPAASHTAFAEAHATPLERARHIAELSSSGPHDPAPAVPASDLVQRDARPR